MVYLLRSHTLAVELMASPTDSHDGIGVYQRSAASKSSLAEIKEKENKLRMRPAKGTLLPAELTASRAPM